MDGKFNKLQKLALTEVILLIVQVAVGLFALIAVSFPEFADQSVNTLLQIGLLLFVAFMIPGIPAFSSALTLMKTPAKLNETLRRRAGQTQTVVFWICIATIIPAASLAFNGFPIFLIDCVIGIVLWPQIRKEISKAVAE